MSDIVELEKMRKDFQFTLSKVSHEIRNPVTLIKSFLQMMAAKYPQVESYDYWNDIQENMEYLIDLLNELSVYNNANRLHRELTQMEDFTKGIVSSIRTTMEYLGIEVKLDVKTSLPPIAIDRTKLRSAILNIIRNASEAMPGYGHIRLTLNIQEIEENPHLLLSIANDGPAIPSEHLDTLFDPFITHKQGGSGLGLAIVRQVVTAHDGRIHVTSMPGQDTIFRLLLPVE